MLVVVVEEERSIESVCEVDAHRCVSLSSLDVPDLTRGRQELSREEGCVRLHLTSPANKRHNPCYYLNNKLHGVAACRLHCKPLPLFRMADGEQPRPQVWYAKSAAQYCFHFNRLKLIHSDRCRKCVIGGLVRYGVGVDLSMA